MARVSVFVCDVCHDASRGAVTYRVATDDRSAKVDLCEEHGAPLAALLKSHARRPAPRPKFEEAVATFEEIQAMKRKGR